MDPSPESESPPPIRPRWNIYIGDNARPGIYATISVGFALSCFSECGHALNPARYHGPLAFRPTMFLGVFLFATGAILYGRSMKPPRWAMQIGILTAVATGVLTVVLLWRYMGLDEVFLK
ncbi:MAG: hypothetical protein HYY18_17800 [Planctomycetes bacterium]|nr:hypothetical protein [Planctomycetota bacterium]